MNHAGHQTLTGIIVDIDRRGGQQFNTVAVYGYSRPEGAEATGKHELARVVITGDRPAAGERDYAIGDLFDVTIRPRARA